MTENTAGPFNIDSSLEASTGSTAGPDLLRLDGTRAFMHALWPGDSLPAEGAILIWTLPDKTSYWCNSVEDAIEQARKQDALRADVYTAVGLGPRGLGGKVRATAAQVRALPGLWADLDYAADVHQKQNLPSKAEALEFIETISPRPTMVVHTGHGFHLWWLFAEPMILQTAEDRKRAGDLERGWVYHLRDLMKERGWTIDSVIDLSRVLRVPGTMNRKRQPYVPAEITAL